MPSLSVLVHICLILFTGFTVYQVQQNDFLASLRFIEQRTSERNVIGTKTSEAPAYRETRLFRLKVLELPAPASKENKDDGFLPPRNTLPPRKSLPNDKVFHVQKYRVEEEWHKYCCVTKSIPDKIEDESFKTALSIDVKPKKPRFTDLVISVMIVLGLCIVLIRLRFRNTFFATNQDYRTRVANLVYAFLQRAFPRVNSFKALNLPEDASFLSLFHFLSPHYKVKSKLGNGAFGSVYRAVDLQSSKEVAIKFSTSSSCTQSVLDEGSVMKQLQHENILRELHTYFADGSAALVMELMDGTLARLKGNEALEAGHLAVIFRQLLQGLDFIHQKNFIHRDIKCPNILINRNGQIKIADFGLAISVRDVPCQFGRRVGTVNWMAPEMIARQPYDKKVDIWSLGVVLIELIDGRECYRKIVDKEKVFQKIMKYGAVSKKIHRFSNPYLEDFLSDMLTYDPCQRPSARDLLYHPFIEMYEPAEWEESLASLLEEVRL